MDLRKKIQVSSYHKINIPLGEPYVIDDDNGNEKTEYETVEKFTLSQMLSQIEELNIPKSEFENIYIYLDYSYSYNDPSIVIEYRKPKTQEEMDKEVEQLRQEYENKRKEKEKLHQEKMKKKAEKQKALSSLTQEQRKALGYDS